MISALSRAQQPTPRSSGAASGVPTTLGGPMASPATATDEALAERFQQGDAAAFEALVARYHRPVYHFAYRLLGRAEDAEDATQDVFIQVYGALPRARLDVPLRPWIYRIARNRCLDVLKRKRAIAFSALAADDDEAAVPDVPDADPLPDELAERADLQRLLGAAIDALPPAYREVVALRYRRRPGVWRDCPGAQHARELGQDPLPAREGDASHHAPRPGDP